MDQLDTHHPLRLCERVQELFDADDLDTLRQEFRHWQPWLEPRRPDRHALNRRLHQWALDPSTATPDEEV